MSTATWASGYVNFEVLECNGWFCNKLHDYVSLSNVFCSILYQMYSSFGPLDMNDLICICKTGTAIFQWRIYKYSPYIVWQTASYSLHIVKVHYT